MAALILEIARSLPESIKAVLRPIRAQFAKVRDRAPPMEAPRQPESAMPTPDTPSLEVPAEEHAYPWAGITHPPETVSDDVYFRHYSAGALENRRFYNIGAGTFRHRFWTNIDHGSAHFAGQQLGSDFVEHDLLWLAKWQSRCLLHLARSPSVVIR